MKFPNFLMNRSFSARAFVLIAGLFLLSSASFAQKTTEAATTLNIEQCANGPLSSPIHCDVTGANDGYTRGNLVSSKSHYFEGDSVPIRITSENLPLGSYTVTIGYDFTKGGKYATDYLTDYDRTESVMNNPCVGIQGCNLGSFTTFPIPVDSDVTNGFDQMSGTGDDITQIPGVFTCFGCTITGVSSYTLTGSVAGDSSKLITLSFTNTQANIVIAYGSHISTRADWGFTHSAINITGSPYHNFIAAISANYPANNGNRDLQLSADAVIFPASVTITKLVDNSDGTYSNNLQNFGFTATNFGMATFNLMDTNPLQFAGGSTSNSNIILFGSGNTITVSEDATSNGYSLSDVSCSISSGDGPVTGTAVGNLGTRTGTIVVEEGNIAQCTFTNTRLGVTAAPASITGRVLTTSGSPVRGVYIKLTDVTTGEVRTALTNSFGFYTFTDLTVEHFYQMTAVSTKKYQFDSPTRTFTLTEDLTGVDFITSSF